MLCRTKYNIDTKEGKRKEEKKKYWPHQIRKERERKKGKKKRKEEKRKKERTFPQHRANENWNKCLDHLPIAWPWLTVRSISCSWILHMKFSHFSYPPVCVSKHTRHNQQKQSVNQLSSSRAWSEHRSVKQRLLDSLPLFTTVRLRTFTPKLTPFDEMSRHNSGRK